MPPSVAVAIPCLNEEATISDVVAGFRDALPDARICVYDNGSTDGTAAQAAGAVVRSEPRRGKGNVVRRIFDDIDADVLVLVDGDGTYPAGAVVGMVRTLVEDQLDMVCGARIAVRASAYPAGHRFGNVLITAAVGLLFGRRFGDVLTGYRVLSRRFVKSFPARSAGFEVETEMAVHALQMRMPTAEVDIPYVERAPGSRSKLRTVRDGLAIAGTIAALHWAARPLTLLVPMFGILEAAAAVVAWPLLAEPLAVTFANAEYVATGGAVPRLPAAVLATGAALLGMLCLGGGMLLNAIARARLEARRLHYLSFRAPAGGAGRSDRGP